MRPMIKKNLNGGILCQSRFTTLLDSVSLYVSLELQSMVKMEASEMWKLPIIQEECPKRVLFDVRTFSTGKQCPLEE